MNYGVDLHTSVWGAASTPGSKLQTDYREIIAAEINNIHCVVHFCIFNSMFARLGADYEINNQ